MDGEISRETSRFLVRRLGADSELCGAWARYHLVRDCLRHHNDGLVVDNLGIDLCGRVQQALADEAPQAVSGRFAAALSKRGRFTQGWLKPVAGMAVAASVALMAIMTVGPGQSPLGTPAGELAGSQQTKSFVSPNNVLARSPRPEQASVFGGTGNSNQRLKPYVQRHYQVTGSTGYKGFVLVPIVVAQGAAQAVAKSNLEGSRQGDPESLTEEVEDSREKDSLTGGSLDRADKSRQQ